LQSVPLSKLMLGMRRVLPMAAFPAKTLLVLGKVVFILRIYAIQMAISFVPFTERQSQSNCHSREGGGIHVLRQLPEAPCIALVIFTVSTLTFVTRLSKSMT